MSLVSISDRRTKAYGRVTRDVDSRESRKRWTLSLPLDPQGNGKIPRSLSESVGQGLCQTTSYPVFLVCFAALQARNIR
jgi:hypothetical protein